MSSLQSWGNYPKIENTHTTLFWLSDEINITKNVLAFGNGRSYGDSCLNEQLISTRGLNRFISFDCNTGYLKCEAGVLLSEIIAHFLPLGWFPMVVPGTQFVTIGGAIANDIHSKNHHIVGTFGNNVNCFELLKSDGQRLLCSKEENTELFKATIGGLGLTGLITWAEIKLKKVINQFIDVETIKFENIDEFFQINQESKDFEYTVSWLDANGCGHYIRGNHNQEPGELFCKKSKISLNFPFNTPSCFLNKHTLKFLSFLYYNKQFQKINKFKSNYEPFFFPLDKIQNWNRAYGKKGFFQFQSVIPFTEHKLVIKEMLHQIRTSEEGTFLSVLKTFGDIKSPGMLSFPMPGLTLAVDFANKGESTKKLIQNLEKITLASGGRIYPAKDALMSKESFHKSYSNFSEFLKHKDPNFNSSFLNRIL